MLSYIIPKPTLMLGVHRSKLLHINAHSRFAHTHLHFFLPLNAVQNPPPHILSLACSFGNTTTPNNLPLLLFPPTQTHALSITTHLPLSSQDAGEISYHSIFLFSSTRPIRIFCLSAPFFFLIYLSIIPITRSHTQNQSAPRRHS